MISFGFCIVRFIGTLIVNKIVSLNMMPYKIEYQVD
jgi:hypothetical protein